MKMRRIPAPKSRVAGAHCRALLQRGIDDGTFRSDLTATELQFLLGQLLQAAARMTAGHRAGVEKAAALITSVFLTGTQNRAEPAPRQDRSEAKRPTERPIADGAPHTDGTAGRFFSPRCSCLAPMSRNASSGRDGPQVP